MKSFHVVVRERAGAVFDTFGHVVGEGVWIILELTTIDVSLIGSSSLTFFAGLCVDDEEDSEGVWRLADTFEVFLTFGILAVLWGGCGKDMGGT